MTLTADEAAAELKRQLDKRAAAPLPLGLHFDLAEEYHHADRGLGSTNIRTLAKAPADYWHASWMNPARPEDRDTEARLYGRAMHTLVFEGEEAFGRRYARGPDQRRMTTAEKQKSTRAANEQAATHGRVGIKAESYDRIAQTAHTIKMNPALATIFQGGHAEVTFIWEHEGIRYKARYDYLKALLKGGVMTAAIGDLKSVANEGEKHFPQACYDAMDYYRYDVQAAHYVDSLASVPDAIREGRVHGFRGDRAFLDRLASHKAKAFQFIFCQKVRAPTTFSMAMSQGNKFLEDGRSTAIHAINNYRQYLERHGVNQWVDIYPVEEAEIERRAPWVR